MVVKNRNFRVTALSFMTIREKIITLNRNFQKSHYADDLNYFGSVGQEYMLDILRLVDQTIPVDHSLRLRINPALTLISDEVEQFEKIANKKEANERVKDNYLIKAKQNVSLACWDIIHAIWNYDERILNQMAN
jgi:hypothetical protein